MDYRMGAAEAKFAEIIWDSAPLPSGELVKLSGDKLGWKKSTVYTVLRRLCEKGLFENVEGIVRVKITRAQFYSERSERFVAESFSGSLPAFIAAFTARKPLSDAEADEIVRMIEAYRKEHEQ